MPSAQELAVEHHSYGYLQCPAVLGSSETIAAEEELALVERFASGNLLPHAATLVRIE